MPTQPMPDRSEVRNRVAVKNWIEVPDVPFAAGKKRHLPLSLDWCQETQRWWAAVRTMPHCVLWSESDWQYAITTALVHNQVWGHGEVKMANELRIRERLLGVTEEARRERRIRYMPEGAEPTPSTKLAPVTHISGAPAKPARSRPRAIDPESVGK